MGDGGWRVAADGVPGQAAGWVWDHGGDLLRIGFGLVEAVSGVVLSETGLGAVAGIPLAVYGVDQVLAGARNIAYGTHDRAGVEELVYLATGSETAAVLVPAAATLSLWAVGPRLARVGARAVVSGEALTLAESRFADRARIPWQYGRVPEDALGITTRYGDIFIRPGLTGDLLWETVRHEGVHRFFSAKTGPLRELRAKWGIRGYHKSHLLRYVEEAIAESFGTDSLAIGLSYPLRGGYELSMIRVLAEGVGYVIVVGGATYGACRLSDYGFELLGK